MPQPQIFGRRKRCDKFIGSAIRHPPADQPECYQIAHVSNPQPRAPTEKLIPQIVNADGGMLRLEPLDFAVAQNQPPTLIADLLLNVRG